MWISPLVKLSERPLACNQITKFNNQLRKQNYKFFLIKLATLFLMETQVANHNICVKFVFTEANGFEQ